MSDRSPMEKWTGHYQKVYWYDSEVQNGGHLQYFENRGTSVLHDTLAALELLGASCQRGVLEGAALLLSTSQRHRINTVENYIEAAREAKFAASDSAYHACQPPIEKLLAEYFQEYKHEFIEIEDDD
jgi:hypothetical protein